MQLPDERLDLLIACVKHRNAPDELTGLRLTLLTDADALDGLLRAADRRLLVGALVDGLEEKGIIHPAAPRPGQPETLRSQLFRVREQYRDRRAAQEAALKEIVAALNKDGIVPLVIKGAVSLLTGEPAWRFQRDIDFAIDRNEADRTMAVLYGLGFDVLKAMSARHHHLDCLSRGDPPVVVEPHLRIDGPRAARILRGLPTMSAAMRADYDGLEVRLLRPEHALLHGMVHHHFENRGNHFGVIALKGLLEFAHMLASLDEEAVSRLADILEGRPTLRAAAELWIAASDEWLCVDPPEGLRPGGAAYRRLARITARLETPKAASMGTALGEDMAGIAAAMRTDGMRSLRHVGVLAMPVFGSLHNRPWGGRPRALKAAGLLALD